MLSKCIKYPQIADYKRTIQELDTKQFVSLRFMLSEIRNHHCHGFENLLHNHLYLASATCLQKTGSETDFWLKI